MKTEQEKLESIERGKALAAKLRKERKSSGQAKRVTKRVALVEFLLNENTPDARKLKKQLNTSKHGRSLPSAGDWYNPSGKRRVSHK